MNAMRPFYGLFRGVVEDNNDPDNLGRIQVRIPAVSKNHVRWASSCFPFVNKQEIFKIPQAGTEVWIEFEDGDGNKPVWLGIILESRDESTK